MNEKELANKTIDRLGGTSVVARLCDITTASVSDWRHNGIPKAWLKYFQCIRPDVFAEERKQKAKAA